jgi:hypothetical protein
MPLEFRQDAICLSGLTGSKVKSEVIGEYYSFWWGITSGGQSENYRFSTALVELDAATGEVYIEDTKETILGSSGHALELKCSNPKTRNLKVILVEKDAACYAHLKNVIRRRWSIVDIDSAEGPLQYNSSNIYLMNMPLDHALSNIEKIPFVSISDTVQIYHHLYRQSTPLFLGTKCSSFRRASQIIEICL